MFVSNIVFSISASDPRKTRLIVLMSRSNIVCMYNYIVRNRETYKSNTELDYNDKNRAAEDTDKSHMLYCCFIPITSLGVLLVASLADPGQKEMNCHVGQHGYDKNEDIDRCLPPSV